MSYFLNAIRIKCAIFIIGLLFPQLAFSESCETNPIYCTPAQLCEKTTETVDNTRYWIEDESDNHLKLAKKFGLDCGAKKALSKCQRDEETCSIIELCEVATTKVGQIKTWNTLQEDHVRLARSFGLLCDTVDDKSDIISASSAYSNCRDDLGNCKNAELCEVATDGNKQLVWQTSDFYRDFVNEAKRRGLTCNVKEVTNQAQKLLPEIKDKNATPCEQNPAACITEALCEKATYQLGKSAPQWKRGDFKKFVDEAKLRGLTCGVGTAIKKTVTVNENTQTSYDKCDASLTSCAELDLCTAATIGTGNNKRWKVGAYIKYVNEAKRRGLGCGIKNSVFKDQKIQPKKIEAKSDLEVCTDQVGNRTTCNDAKLCAVATIVSNGSKKWVQRPIQLVNEAKRRGLSCGVVKDKKRETAYTRCNSSVKECADKDLCSVATWGGSTKHWKIGSYAIFVNEAKRRGLSCGVISGSSGSNKQPPKSNTYAGKCSKTHDNLANVARNFFNQSNHKSWKSCYPNSLVFSDGSQIIVMWNGNIKYGKGKFGVFSSQIYCLDRVTKRVRRSRTNSCD